MRMRCSETGTEVAVQRLAGPLLLFAASALSERTSGTLCIAARPNPECPPRGRFSISDFPVRCTRMSGTTQYTSSRNF